MRDVHRALGGRAPGFVTSIQNRLEIMVDKGLVTLDEGRPRRFRAAMTESRAKRHLLNDLIHRVFGGSVKNVVLQALSVRKASPAEIAEIRQKLDELDRGCGSPV